MHNKSVLLVDDEQPVLTALGNYLENNAFKVKPVQNGEDALAQFRSSFFDLVITDAIMAGIGGLDVLREIRKNNNEVGVFILTGHGNMSLAIEAFRSGADDFIQKPCDVDVLVHKMKSFFEKQDALRKLKIYQKFLPICMYCKKIRDDNGGEPGKGRWVPIEEYICQKSGTDLTHGCCPECFEEHVDIFRK